MTMHKRAASEPYHVHVAYMFKCAEASVGGKEAEGARQTALRLHKPSHRQESLELDQARKLDAIEPYLSCRYELLGYLRTCRCHCSLEIRHVVLGMHMVAALRRYRGWQPTQSASTATVKVARFCRGYVTRS
jgi:hypothetical protein